MASRVLSRVTHFQLAKLRSVCGADVVGPSLYVCTLS